MRLLIGARRILVGFVHFNLAEVHLPQQAVQFLFVAPVPVEHERHDAQQQQGTASNARRYLARVACRWMRELYSFGLIYRLREYKKGEFKKKTNTNI